MFWQYVLIHVVCAYACVCMFVFVWIEKDSLPEHIAIFFYLSACLLVALFNITVLQELVHADLTI